MISLLLIVAAIVAFLWAALIDAGHIDLGATLQVLCIGLALLAAASLPWRK